MDAAAGRRGVHFGWNFTSALPLLARCAAPEKTAAARRAGRRVVHGNPGKPKIRRRMIHGIHVEVILAGGYALLLVCVSRSEEHTSELQSLRHLVCRLLLE